MYTKHKQNSDVHYNFSYVKYLPKDLDENKKYPLVFFLHGAGERGDDLDMAVKHGYMKHVREEGREYPFIFIAPQCPKQKYWGCFTKSLLAFLDDICETFPIDRDRGESINMISSVNKKGGHAQIKILYGVAHSAWEQAYSDDSFLDWMLQQKRVLPEAP